jgi:hypothetical protein
MSAVVGVQMRIGPSHRMNAEDNPLPPCLTLDATLARQALGWQSQRNARQTIA